MPVFLTASAAAIPKPRAWPNPFNPATGPVQIGFFLEERADVTLGFYTLSGRLLRQITQRYDAPGNQIASWDGAADGGGRVAPGGYVVLVTKRYAGRTDSARVKVAVLY